MRLRLSKSQLRGIREQVINKSSVSSARIIKKHLYVRAAEQEKKIEAAYAHALKDLTHILKTKSRLPGAPSISGNKQVLINPYGMSSTKSVMTPHYRRLAPFTMAMHRRNGAGKKVFWYESGWYARQMSARLLRSNKDWKLRRVRFKGKLSKQNRLILSANVRAPALYSRVLNRIIMEPFFSPEKSLPSVPKTSLSSVNNVVGRSVFLESKRPLLSVVMRQHGKEAWKILKSDLL